MIVQVHEHITERCPLFVERLDYSADSQIELLRADASANAVDRLWFKDKPPGPATCWVR
jgi:hypothetical protein